LVEFLPGYSGPHAVGGPSVFSPHPDTVRNTVAGVHFFSF